MLPKWKLILTNWIDCYFNSTNPKDLPLNLESLVDIISHLRENLNLDETKSSLLDAHTVQEFIAEKFPGFKFKNGTTEPDDEEDVYLVASLLLFFLCVNSKNVDIKSAMCSKLSPGDQEVILKFSKHLMECSKINITDVQTAITEACGQYILGQPTALGVSAAETPPALRSFHSEVRRLQAALDAERFDRTYLQEELTRTNMKVEKLLKDKEQYKLEIVNLKSQISMCCGQERESQGEDRECSNVSKLMRQLEQTEERLVSAQEQLENVQEERETYRAKLSRLKLEHEKLLALSHQESVRASTLAEELEVERRRTQSLQELVVELRQHNHLNRMDSSLLECDDPNASINSLLHNSSGCSEVCANVIEVQLGEERAKIVALKQQIQTLQDQLTETTKKTEEQKESLTKIIYTREDTIMTLKHRVNEELEENNTLKVQFHDEVAKLSNDIMELEERLKRNQENSRNIIETKMKEIQNLQEEKLSLLQSLSDETTKSENIIKCLKDEIDAEKSAKIRQKDEYDSMIMKLNEKILNRNNELAELQSKILEKGEIIETLQLELRREKELREEISNKHNEELTQLNGVREQLERQCEVKDEQCKYISETLSLLEQRFNSAQEQLLHAKEERETLETKLGQMKVEYEKLLMVSHEESARASSLAEKLEVERGNIVTLQQKIQVLQDQISENTRKTEQKKEEWRIEEEILKQIISEKENTIMSFKVSLDEEKEKKVILQKHFDDEIAKLNEEILEQENEFKGTQENLRHVIENKMKEIQKLQEEKISLLQSLTDETSKAENIIKHLKDEIDAEKSYIVRQKDEYDSSIIKLNEKILNRNNELVDLKNKIKEKGEIIETLQLELRREKEMKEEISNKHNEELTHLNGLREQLEQDLQRKVEEVEDLHKHLQLHIAIIETKDIEYNNISETLRQLELNLHTVQEQLAQAQEERETYKIKLGEAESQYEKLLVLSHQESARANRLDKQLEAERANIVALQQQILMLQDLISKNTRHTEEEKEKYRVEGEKLRQNISEMENTIMSLKQEIQTQNVFKTKLEDEIAKLKKQVTDKEDEMKTSQERSQSVIKNKMIEIQNLQEEKLSLLQNLSDETSKFENIIKHLRHEIDTEKSSKVMLIDEYDNNILILNEKILKMNNELIALQNKIQEKDEVIETLKLELRREKELREEISNKHYEELTQLNGVRERLERKYAAKDVECNNTSETLRQLERRLNSAQEEKETCEAKFGQMKSEHEKLLALSHQESVRASALAEELEIEKMNNMTLQQQILMLQDKVYESTRNTEESREEQKVQGEKLKQVIFEMENKIISLKQRLDEEIHEKITYKTNLEDEVAKLNEKLIQQENMLKATEENSQEIITEMENENMSLKQRWDLEIHEKNTYKTNLEDEIAKLNEKLFQQENKLKATEENSQEIITEMENEIMSLKQRLDLEIHEKNTYKTNLEDEVAKLNEKLIQQENKLKATEENSQHIIESKIKQIQILEEEKLSLLQNLSEETSKSENIIKHLKDEIDAVKSSKVRQRDEYDSLIMNFNEKIGNRNNELVELQNKILEKGETIETLQLELRKEKVLREEISNKHNEELTHLNEVRERLEREYAAKDLECNNISESLRQLEQRLHSTQEQLVNAQEEKETYEAKLSQLKSEQEELSALSHEKSARASTLAEELEVERRRTQSLQELVVELRQHNHLNRMDSSLFQCDDADASMNSLPHYSSACSDMGSNVIEAQLEEERANIVALKRQIQTLQDQISHITRQTEEENEKHSNEKEKLENTITSLKHRVNEEIEEKNNLKTQFDDKVAKLNNEFIELEQRLKGTQENSRNIIENKMKEIQNLKEEKMSLLKSFSDETNKSENIIKNLREDIDAEKAAKIRQRDEYDSMIMKLNEKIGNRNNELVELQNKILEKGETIETLQLELRREKELREEISNKHNEELTHLNGVREQLQKDLQRKSEEVEDLQKHLQHHIALIEQINEDNEHLKANVLQLQADCKTLKDAEEKLLAEVKNRDVRAEQIYKETENLKNLLCEEQQKLQNITEKASPVTAQQSEVKPATEHTGNQISNALATPLLLQTCMDAANQEKSSYKSVSQGTDGRDAHPQVDTTPSDHTPSSFECCKTISDLEKILQDRNRTIRSLQSDITDLKSLVAESENKLLDVSNDLEVSKENCHQLSSQLKKIVHQKNEEIADLKKQLTKMSVTENRATQIIKVSAKYQAIILKRIAEIKSNTVLKELTNFGNSTNCDNELRRGLNTKTITMEDLENFLDTTDRHLKRFSEKQIALQKERDRLIEVNKINESEIINMRKFLTELSVSIKTFNSVKELYGQKLSRVVSLQRTVRREILGLDGQVTDTTLCRLERGYAAVMQDLAECAMNLERWVERTLGRVISVEKIKQAITSEERSSVAPTTVQNAGLEVQLEELENSFCKLLEEIARAQKGDAAKVSQAATVMEVRAEYEDKLNRMKAKMKELYQEQIGIFKEKQKEEIGALEQELQRARDKLEESSRAYEEHIRSLTTELWSVGEKFLMKKDEAEWLRRKQRSGSLMSLQHTHSSGLASTQEEPSRPSDTHSLRSLPVANNNGKGGRTLHMSDEEGEVFDNRCLRELATTPRARGAARGSDAPRRLSELQWRNSLCPPHLKSSYPAETQFVPAIHEEDIKCVGPTMSLGGRSQRKEVGITAYKKPGPPTPSKQAGRLSATDSELRESLRVEMEPNASRKTSTPSRIRALFRSGKGDNEGTPRSRRLSNIFRKK